MNKPHRFLLRSLASTALLLSLTPGCSDDPGGGDADAGAATDAQTDVSTDPDATADAGPTPPKTPEIGPPRDLKTCAGGTSSLYDPLGGQELSGFPDDFFTEWTGVGETQLRPVLTPDSVAWLKTLPAGFQKVFIDLSELDGWGTSADLFVRFSGRLGALPVGVEASLSSPAIALIRVDDGVRLPFEATTTDDGTTLLVSPLLPLRPKTRHALVVTRSLLDEKGACVAPGKPLQNLLEGREAGDAAAFHTARLRAAAKAAKVELADVTAILAFTTQSIVDRSLAVADAIDGPEPVAKYGWAPKAKCAAAVGSSRQCDGAFEARDFRGWTGAVAPPSWKLDVRVWLPATGEGPWPVVIYGHGLGSGRSQGKKLAQFATPLGVAVVAIDALRHEDHPSGGGKGTLDTVLKFFGIDAVTLSFDFLALRDHWRQSTWDKLQLIELLKANPDIDGDGKVDLLTDKLGYLGVSLGGIMGPELLALSSDIDAAILSVPGGKVSSIIQSSKQFGPLIYAFKPEGTSDGDVDRFFAVLQTLLDAGDAASYAPYVLKARIRGPKDHAPHLLIQMAIGDDIVPNVATRNLARGLGIPIVAPVVQPISTLVAAPTVPFSNNVAGVTAGLFQFDRVRDHAKAPVQASDHSGTPASYEAFAQDSAFLSPWLAGNAPQIIDPYAELQTPPLKN